MWRLGMCAMFVGGCVEQHPAWIGGAGTDGGTGSAGTSSVGSTGPTTAATGATGDATGGGSTSGSTDTTGVSATTGEGSSTGTGGSTGGGVTHRIFVTSTVQTADFGGFAQADGICQGLADTAGLGGTFISVLGEATTTVDDRVTLQGPVVNMLGEQVAPTEATLWNGVITASVAYDEDGMPATGLAWTGADVGGIGSANDCQTWTATNGNGAVGDVTMVGPGWLRSGTNQCGLTGPLYCIEQ